MKEYAPSHEAALDEEEKRLLSQATSRVEGTTGLMAEQAKKDYIALLDMLSTEVIEKDTPPAKKEDDGDDK